MEERTRRLLVKQNPWWRNEREELPEFERDMLQVLKAHMKYKQIVGLIGLRRTGKTVLLKQLIRKLDVPVNNICYISLDDLEFQKYDVAGELIDYFLEFSDIAKRRYLFLDEIQKLPNWADLLKTAYDTEQGLKILISGSASLELREHKETLAGRIITFHLPVLTFGEFVRYSGLGHQASLDNLPREYDLKFADKKGQYIELFRRYVQKGAFPELLDIDDEDFIRRYIMESVIEKAIVDVGRLAGEDERVIYELFRLLANSNARLFEIGNLANVLRVNRNRVSRCLVLLEKSFLIKIAYNYTSSVAKQVRSSKKQYLAHSSLVMAALDYPAEILNSEVGGHLVESMIVNHIVHTSFWRSPQKDEVDIVVKDWKRVLPVEVKYQSHITNSDLRPLVKFCRKYNVKKGIVVTKDLLDRKRIDGCDIEFVPAWLFLIAWKERPVRGSAADTRRVP